MGALLDKIKGKLMKGEGKLTGDKVRTGQGHVVEKKGKVKDAINEGVRRVKGKVNETRARGRMAKGKAKRKATAARRMP
jgi:uncharacterized protein YjbJ (UPF0337 family)